MGYLTNYRLKLQKLEAFKNKILDETYFYLHDVYGKPLKIGNMVYWICEDENRKLVPAYRYLNDKEDLFFPIYDKNGNCEYGWFYFEEVCRICEMIKKEIEKIVG